MSIFEEQLAKEEQAFQEMREQGETMGQPYEGNLENAFQSDASEKQRVYQDRVNRMEQRNAERQRAAEERTVRQNEISFGSRAVENSANKLEERRKLERQIKQQEEKLRIDEKGLSRSVDSNYWTNHYAQEIKSDARNIKNLEKKLSEL